MALPEINAFICQKNWCRFHCRANPGCLGTLGHFQERFVRVIETGQTQDSTKRELAEARKGVSGAVFWKQLQIYLFRLHHMPW